MTNGVAIINPLVSRNSKEESDIWEIMGLPSRSVESLVLRGPCALRLEGLCISGLQARL